jgi:hypothetical protein
MGDSAKALLQSIMNAYPFEGGGNCNKAAVFHSHMLNTFKPAFDALYPAAAYVAPGPDEETPLEDVVNTDWLVTPTEEE